MDDNWRQVLIAIVSALVGIVVAGLGIRAGSKAVAKAAANQKAAQDAAWAREDRWRWAAEKRALYEPFIEGADLLRRIAYDVATHGKITQLDLFGPTAEGMLGLASKMAVIAQPSTTAGAHDVIDNAVRMVRIATGHPDASDGAMTYEQARAAHDQSVEAFQRVTREELTGIDAFEGLRPDLEEAPAKPEVDGHPA